MLLGIILVFSGMLIAIYPPLLSIIVASLLIVLGVFIFYLSWRYKQATNRIEDPFVDFFMRM